MKKITAAFLVILLCTVFLLVPERTNFESGHHGWVSSHSLAIADKAIQQNGFLGYTCKHIDSDTGNTSYYYFDRYPVFFSAISNIFLSKADTLENKIIMLRYVMSVIFIITLIASYLLFIEIGVSSILSAGATFLVASGTYSMQYYDMFHYDQPALMGLTLFLLFFLKYKKQKTSKRKLLIIASFAVLFGRGYATNLVILFWFMLEEVANIISSKSVSLKRILNSTSFQILVVTGALSTAALSSNIYLESKIRNVSISETSIVSSALARTGLNKNDHMEESIASFSMLKSQSVRIVQNLVPYSLSMYLKPQKWSKVSKDYARKDIVLLICFVISFISFIGIFTIIFKSIRSQNLYSLIPGISKVSFFVFVLAGFFWCIPMTNLTYYHDYTVMYYLSTFVFIYYVLVRNITDKKSQIIFSAFCTLILISSSVMKLRLSNYTQANLPGITEDMQRIINIADEKNLKLSIDGGRRKLVEEAPYAACFYIGERGIYSDSKFVITKNRELGLPLTPNNETYFLVQKK